MKMLYLMPLLGVLFLLSLSMMFDYSFASSNTDLGDISVFIETAESNAVKKMNNMDSHIWNPADSKTFTINVANSRNHDVFLTSISSVLTVVEPVAVNGRDIRSLVTEYFDLSVFDQTQNSMIYSGDFTGFYAREVSYTILEADNNTIYKYTVSMDPDAPCELENIHIEFEFGMNFSEVETTQLQTEPGDERTLRTGGNSSPDEIDLPAQLPPLPAAVPDLPVAVNESVIIEVAEIDDGLLPQTGGVPLALSLISGSCLIVCGILAMKGRAS